MNTPTGPLVPYTYSTGYDTSYLGGRCGFCCDGCTCFDRYWLRLLGNAHQARGGSIVGERYDCRLATWALEYVSTQYGACLVLHRPAGSEVDGCAYHVLREALAGRDPLPDGWAAVHFPSGGAGMVMLTARMVRGSRDVQVGTRLANDVTLAQLLAA